MPVSAENKRGLPSTQNIVGSNVELGNTGYAAVRVCAPLCSISQSHAASSSDCSKCLTPAWMKWLAIYGMIVAAMLFADDGA